MSNRAEKLRQSRAGGSRGEPRKQSQTIRLKGRPVVVPQTGLNPRRKEIFDGYLVAG